jgi:O-antigen/teichoic acid export membrane protein
MGLYTVMQAGTLLLVARMLGPAQFGAFAAIASLAVLLGSFSTFGTNIVLLGEVARAPSRRAQILPYAIPTTLLCGGVLLAIYLTACTLALPITSTPWSVLLAVGVTELWLQPLFSLAVCEHHGLGHIAGSQLLKTLPSALRLIAAASILLIHTSDRLVMYANVYPMLSLGALIWALTTFPSAWPSPRQWRLPRMTELRETAGYAALAITAAGPGEFDKTLAAKLLPLPAAGIYSAGARVISAITLPVSAMMASALPRLFRDGRDQLERTRHLLLRILGATVAYMLVAAVALCLISPAFEWIFGERYRGLGHTIRWLCLAVPGLAIRMSAGTIMMALGKPWARVWFEVSGLMVLIVAAVVLAPRFGALGMPLALACSEWFMAAFGIALILSHIAPPRAKL